MLKTNKELDVDIVVEIIRANPKVVYKATNVSDGVSHGIDLKAIINCIKSVHKTLSDLE